MTEQKKTRRQMLEEFVAKKPDDAFSLYGLAMECMNGGDPAAADTHFRTLLERNADYIPAYLMYGQLLARESRTSELNRVNCRGRGCGARRFPRVRAYTPAADTRSSDCFAGASTIRATPMMPSTATAISSSPRSSAFWNAIIAITAA